MLKYKLEDIAIVMNFNLDNVAVAKTDIPARTLIEYKDKVIKMRKLIKMGQRFALTAIKKSEFIRQYGHPFAKSRGILRGDLISESNVANEIPEADVRVYKKPHKTKLQKRYRDKSFFGYVRKNGKVGTRNYYLVIPTSMCSSETALQVALSLDGDSGILKKYSNIDGIVAIPHTEGCGCDSGLQIDRLMMVLKGYVQHPNVGGCLIMDLGCEQTNYDKTHKYLRNTIDKNLKPIDWVSIQGSGGTYFAARKARTIIKKKLPEINRVKRKAAPISKIVVGTECGASDSFSGITANPIIGNAVDKIIFGGGSAILSEVTELLGTFGMFLSRFRNLKTAHKFKSVLEWYEEIARKLGLSLEANLVPQNIEGGLINNYVKSLGAAMKGGTTVIEDVLDYGESVKRKGLSIMQGPGNDPESLTGMVASGVNIVCFSTGKGTTTGEAVCPIIKIASNETAFKKLSKDMDFDGSQLLRGKSLDVLGEELLDKIILVASGKKTWSERWKQRQFQVWTAGKLSL